MTSPIFPDPPKHLVSLNSRSTDNTLYCLLVKIPEDTPMLKLKSIRSRLDKFRSDGFRLVQGFGRDCREIYQKKNDVSKLWNLANDDHMATTRLSLVCFEGKPNKDLVSEVLSEYDIKIWFKTGPLIPFSGEMRDLLSWQRDYKAVRVMQGKMNQYFAKWAKPSQMRISPAVKDKLNLDFELVEIAWNELISTFQQNVVVRNCAYRFFEDIW